MKEFSARLAAVLKTVFGYGIMITLFAAGLTFFGYLAALCIGGETAALISTFLYKKLLTVIIYAATSLILLGLLSMYLTGDHALTAAKK